MGGREPLVNSVERVRNFHLKDPGHEFTLSTIGADLERADKMYDGLVASRDDRQY